MNMPTVTAPNLLTTAHTTIEQANATIEQFDAIKAQIARSVGKPALVTTEYGYYSPYDPDGQVLDVREAPYYGRTIKGFQLGIIGQNHVEVAENSWSIPTKGVVKWKDRLTRTLEDVYYVGSDDSYETYGPDDSIMWFPGWVLQPGGLEKRGSIVVEPLEGASTSDKFRLGTFVHASRKEAPRVHDIGRTQLFVGIRAIRGVLSQEEKEDPTLSKVLNGDLAAAKRLAAAK